MIKTGISVLGRFLETLTTLPVPELLFRGHANESWDLIPSAFRQGSVGITERDKLQAWSDSASRFADPLPRNDVEWLVLAQHYGIPTPLLDWTASPLVALFFASNMEPLMTGSVLSVSKQKFVRPAELLMVGPFNKDRTKPFLFPAVSMNSRSSAQHAFMSLHTLEETKNGTLSQLPSATFQVTPEEKPSVIEALRLLGITEELIFSDINTAADSFKRKQLS